MRALRIIPLAVASIVSVVTSARARSSIDDKELAAMQSQDPGAVERIERGEALAISGDLAQAQRLFREAREADPEASIAWRRECEALTLLGRRGEAVTSCTHAVQVSHSNANARALVHALVDGPRSPGATELFQALAITSTERDLGPGGATAAAMACDVAERIGDGTMLRRCSEELSRLAPEDPETARAREVLASRCPPLRFWVGWLVIGLSAAITLARVLGRARRRSRGGAAAGLLAVAVLVRPLGASAQDRAPHLLSAWPVDEAHPEGSVPSEHDRNADPLNFGYWLQDCGSKANLASKRGDHAAAIRFYAALVTAVPDRAFGLLQMCGEYEATGDRELAIHACGQALLRDGLTVQDYAHFVHLVLGKPGTLLEEDVATLTHVLDHMKEDPPGRDARVHLECEVGVRTSDVGELAECTAALAESAPDAAETISYEWAYAVLRGDYDAATRIVERARAVGLAPATLDRMETTMASGRRWRWLRFGSGLLGGAFLLAGVGWLAARARSGSRAPRPVPPGV